MVQQSITSPKELMLFQLKSALTMEDHSLEALSDLQSAAQSKKVKKMFSHHSDETKEQIENLHKVFKILDVEVTSAPSQATTGIKNQAASLLERTTPELHDKVTLMSALGNEHFEISMYRGLILQAQSLGMSDVAELLSTNCDQEVHTSKELYSMLKKFMK